MEQLDFETNWQPEEEKRDCPVCGDSGPCYACDRGRAVTEEFKQQAKKAKGSKPKRPYYKKVA